MSLVFDYITGTEKARIYLCKENERSNFLLDLKAKYRKDFDILLRQIERFATFGHIYDGTKFRHLDNGIYEFKTPKIRVLCFMLSGVTPKTILLTNYFIKQKNKAPIKEIDKARRLVAEIEKLNNERKLIL